MKEQFDRRSAAARRDAEAARARVVATLAEIRHRIDPRTVASDAAAEVMGRVNHLLSDATATARSKPGLLAIAATLVGVGLTLRQSMATADPDGSEAGQPNRPEKVDSRIKEN